MKTKIVAFRVAGIPAAALASDVDRILPLEPLLPAPDAPPWVIGLLRSGGKVLAVIDVGKRAFPNHEPNEDPVRFFLAGTFSGVPAVLAVPEIEGILDVENQERPVPGGLPSEIAALLGGVVRTEGTDRVLLDVARLLVRDRGVIEETTLSSGPAAGGLTCPD